jgi:hypothetical protein
MSNKYDRAAMLLIQMQTKSERAAAKACGLSHATPHNWRVASRLGKAELQQVEFCGVVAPFHIHLDNSLSLMMQKAEHDLLANIANAAENGGFVMMPVFFNGQQQFKRLSPREMMSDAIQLQIEVGARAKDDNFAYDDDTGERIPEMQPVKGSDAQTTLRALEAHSKKWRPGAVIEHSHSGTLRLGAAAKPVAVESNSSGAFDDSTAEADKPRLALAAPLPSADVDALAAAGAFEPKPTVIIHPDGRREVKEPIADPTPVMPKAAGVPSTKKTPLPDPVKWEDVLMRPASHNRLLRPDQEIGPDGYPRARVDKRPSNADPATIYGTDPSRRGFPVR